MPALSTMASGDYLGTVDVIVGVMDRILINNAARRNGFTITLFSGIALLLSMVYLSMTSQTLPLAGYFVCAGSIAGLLVGIAKQQEPLNILALDRRGLTYQHKKGQWFVSWQALQRIGQPRVRMGIEHKELNYLGFRLKSPDQLAAVIAPRLASHLLMQQRPLLLANPDADCRQGQCYSESLIEDDRFRLTNGEQLTGLQAMFAHRMQKLRALLGYDIYIEVTELGMPLDKLCDLIREHQRQAQVDERCDPK